MSEKLRTGSVFAESFPDARDSPDELLHARGRRVTATNAGTDEKQNDLQK
jgi:hypothetical protein